MKSALEYVVWCMANESAPDCQLKAHYETLCETEQHRLQKAVDKYGEKDAGMGKVVSDEDYQ